MNYAVSLRCDYDKLYYKTLKRFITFSNECFITINNIVNYINTYHIDINKNIRRHRYYFKEFLQSIISTGIFSGEIKEDIGYNDLICLTYYPENDTVDEDTEINFRNSYYVYKFLDTNNNIIYIGQTNNIRRRIEQEHFTSMGHLTQECYKNTNKVEYVELNNGDEMNIYERYLINIYNPKYNKALNNKSRFSFELPELDWKTYTIHK